MDTLPWRRPEARSCMRDRRACLRQPLISHSRSGAGPRRPAAEGDALPPLNRSCGQPPSRRARRNCRQWGGSCLSRKGRMIPEAAAHGISCPTSGDRLRFLRTQTRLICVADAAYTRTRVRARPSCLRCRGLGSRQTSVFCAAGSGWSIGPSAPWTAFEYKNCTGTRPPPVLLRIS